MQKPSAWPIRFIRRASGFNLMLGSRRSEIHKTIDFFPALKLANIAFAHSRSPFVWILLLKIYAATFILKTSRALF